MLEQQRMGRSCRQKGFRLLELCITALPRIPLLSRLEPELSAKQVLELKASWYRAQGGIWLLSKACNPEHLFFFDPGGI